MNVVVGKYDYQLFLSNGASSSVALFECSIDSCKVSLHTETDFLIIEVKGCKSTEELIELLSDIESLLFFYLGSYPKTLSIQINGTEQDLSNRRNKYQTSSRFRAANLMLRKIDSQTVCADVIDKLRRLKQTPLNSLKYLVSESYDGVAADHKITLLFHIVEWGVDNKTRTAARLEAKQKYSIPNNEDPGKYFFAAYHLCKSYFFNYQIEYKHDILELLETNEKDFLQIMTNTRNWNSHYWYESEEESRLKTGKDITIYFEIIYYVLRLMTIEKLGLKPNDDSIKEFYYSVHDWILEIKYKKDEPLKSIAYSTRKIINEFNANRE